VPGVPAPAAAFYFDLASPQAYLAAERVLHVLPRAAEWQPVLAGGLGPREQPDRDALARSARELGLQPMRWPDPFPFDSSLAMRVATYAKSIGRTVPFAQAAFRQAFAGGHSLADPNFVLIAAAACEMHPAAVLAGAELRSIAGQLAACTAAAAALGVTAVPAIAVGEEVFQGEEAIRDAAAHMAGQSAWAAGN
jgi:2-hydroxychromene-2-carboxylate isomerase